VVMLEKGVHGITRVVDVSELTPWRPSSDRVIGGPERRWQAYTCVSPPLRGGPAVRLTGQDIKGAALG
jgi:hypothetical protein